MTRRQTGLQLRPILTRRLLGALPHLVEVASGRLYVSNPGFEWSAACADIVGVVQRRRFWSTSISITVARGEPLHLNGLERGGVDELELLVDALRSVDRIERAASHLRALSAADEYLRTFAVESWTRDVAPLVPQARRIAAVEVDEGAHAASARFLVEWHDRWRELLQARNEQFVQRELERHRAWFDAAGDKPLTAEQRRAVVVEDDNVLLIAGAGTGKTSTLVAKVRYVLHTRRAKPSEILLLAYNKKAKDEIAERLGQAGVDGVAVHTFHSLGLELIKKAENAAPSVRDAGSGLDERTADQIIRELFLDQTWGARLRRFFLELLRPYEPPWAFETKREYIGHLQAAAPTTLKGDRVRSQEERMIADWLFSHGVQYEYERLYEHKTATPERRQYRPDFYLPTHGIYLEHFGVDREGRTAPFVDEAKYREGMAWKRDLHRKHGTRLIETFSWQAFEGTLTDTLGQRLQALGVPLRPIPLDDLLEALFRQKEVSRLARLLSAFLTLFRGNLHRIRDIGARAASSRYPARAFAFLALFEHVLERYERDLQTRGEIDFDDMIANAVRHLQDGRIATPYRYILVDEFQDISRGRAQLLLALRAARPRDPPRLFCVGDDWQSIYRFTGSDISLLRDFDAVFGASQRLFLTETFRCNDRILAASARFVQENPAQIKKTLKAARRVREPAITVMSSKGKSAEDLEAALRLSKSFAEPWTSALVLGRYRHVLPDEKTRANLEREHGIALECSTVHSAKGKEADIVVLLAVEAGDMGFPAEQADDPLLDLVLPDSEAYPHAEERRLFYVALTRARHHVVIVTQEGRVSTFVDEIDGAAYAGLVARQRAQDKRGTPCPDCGAGVMHRREGKYGSYWACSNEPYCDTRLQRCPSCGEAPFVRSGPSYACAACGQARETCPRCESGWLTARSGRNGPFLGCSRWQSTGDGCSYTRSSRSPVA